MDKEDKVHEFWKKHQEEGEFHVFGLKKKNKHGNEEDEKKHKWKKVLR